MSKKYMLILYKAALAVLIPYFGSSGLKFYTGKEIAQTFPFERKGHKILSSTRPDYSRRAAVLSVICRFCRPSQEDPAKAALTERGSGKLRLRRDFFFQETLQKRKKNLVVRRLPTLLIAIDEIGIPCKGLIYIRQRSVQVITQPIVTNQNDGWGTWFRSVRIQHIFYGVSSTLHGQRSATIISSYFQESIEAQYRHSDLFIFFRFFFFSFVGGLSCNQRLSFSCVGIFVFVDWCVKVCKFWWSGESCVFVLGIMLEPQISISLLDVLCWFLAPNWSVL